MLMLICFPRCALSHGTVCEVEPYVYIVILSYQQYIDIIAFFWPISNKSRDVPKMRDSVTQKPCRCIIVTSLFLKL